MLVNCNHYLGNFIENTALNNTVEISELGTLLRLVHTSRCSQLTLRSRSIAIELPGRTDFISITRQQPTYSSQQAKLTVIRYENLYVKYSTIYIMYPYISNSKGFRLYRPLQALLIILFIKYLVNVKSYQRSLRSGISNPLHPKPRSDTEPISKPRAQSGFETDNYVSSCKVEHCLH